MKRLFYSLFAVILFAFCHLASADQRDPRLDELFDQLQATNAPGEGKHITNTIWEIWRITDNKIVDQYMHQGVVAMGYGNYRVALDSFNYVTRIAPGYAEGWNKRATLFYIVGEFQRSAADVKQTLSLEPRHFGALSGLGMIYEKTNRYEAAIKAFRNALKVNPHLTQAQQNIDEISKRLHGNAI